MAGKEIMGDIRISVGNLTHNLETVALSLERLLVRTNFVN